MGTLTAVCLVSLAFSVASLILGFSTLKSDRRSGVFCLFMSVVWLSSPFVYVVHRGQLQDREDREAINRQRDSISPETREKFSASSE